MTRGYKAILFSPDGDYVTDFSRETIREVNDALADRGSRWIFYPFAFVVRDHGAVRPTQRIVDACEPFEPSKGRTIGTVQAFVREHGAELVEVYA